MSSSKGRTSPATGKRPAGSAATTTVTGKPGAASAGAEDDRSLTPSGSAGGELRHPESATDRARDHQRLRKDLEDDAAGSVSDRHRHGLTATEGEEDGLPLDADGEPVAGLEEPAAPGAEDDDLRGAVTQERVVGLDPDARPGRRRRAGSDR